MSTPPEAVAPPPVLPPPPRATLADPAAPLAVPPDPGPATPQFDVVRVAPDGSTVVAGQAEPGAAVDVQIDGAPVAQAQADAQGRFVALLEVPPAAGPRGLTLQATDADGQQALSRQTVMIAPLAEPERSPAPAAAADAAPSTAPAAPTAPTAAAPPAAVLIDDAGARVLQGGAAEASPRMTIEALTYSTSGDVQIAGRGQPGMVVRLYLDNRPVTDVRTAADGSWRGALPAVAAGLYTLRADLVDAQGRVLSRDETPFQREAPAVPPVAAAQATAPVDAPPMTQITVQPGFTLWQIARETYGSGVMYVRVLDANRATIRDPDLIYPGQIFAVPAPDPGG
jgi:nucleoid-associated protein YgaU